MDSFSIKYLKDAYAKSKLLEKPFITIDGPYTKTAYNEYFGVKFLNGDNYSPLYVKIHGIKNFKK